MPVRDGFRHYFEVNTYGDLPLASGCAAETYLVRTATGIWGINRKRAGLWRSDGASWNYLGVAPTLVDLGGVSQEDFDTHKGAPGVHHGEYTHPTEGACPQTPKAHTAASHSDIDSSGAAIDDAVDKKHDDGLDHSDALDHPEAHAVASHSDTEATGPELDELVDGSETELHSHPGGGGVAYKSGTISVPDQTWTAVTFGTAFADANYAITLAVKTPTVVGDWKMLFYRNKATTGFEIYTKEKNAETVYIDWMATPYNDP